MNHRSFDAQVTHNQHFRPLFWAMFSGSGQICMASKRVFVHENVYDSFRDALVKYASTMKIGDGLDPNVQLGPVQNETQYNKVRCVDHLAARYLL
jgi:acyl-CoA reductase-like NAD-dependent aldehyde dehydrogenase